MPALAAAPQHSEGARPASPTLGQTASQTASLTVVVTATLRGLTPQQATAKLQGILRGSPYKMTASVRRLDQKLPKQQWSRLLPTSGPLEVTFGDKETLELYQRYCVSVQAESVLLPRMAIVQLQRTPESVEVRIPFAQMRVEASPGFDLYVSPSREPLARGSPNPDTLIARSGRRHPTGSAYAVGADDAGVGFVYWPVTLFRAVLTDAETREDRTGILDFTIRSGPPKTLTGEQASVFRRVILRTIEVPQRSRCNCAREERCQ